MRLVLASTSPARLATLRAAGVEPLTIPPGVDEEGSVALAERGRSPLSAAETVGLLARLKAEAVVAEVAARAPADPELRDCLVLGGDSAFELDGTVYGKPHRLETARERWRLQRGRTGHLHSGHWMLRMRDGRAVDAAGEHSVAAVSFVNDLLNVEIDAYIATGEPLTVAGAFTIDGRGAAFVSRIEGDPSTVVGVSIPLLRRLSGRLDVPWVTLWRDEACRAPTE